MPSLRDIRLALAETLSELDGVNVHAEIVETVTAPAIQIVPVAGSNVAFNRGVVEWNLHLLVTTRGEDGQGQLDDLISGATDSIPYLLHAHPTALRNAAEDVAATGVTYTISDQGVTEYGATVVAENVRQWHATYAVRVLAKGTST